MSSASPSASDPARPWLPSGRLLVLLRRLQIWAVRLLLPVLHWRVPVRLLRGTERGSGREIRMLLAGVVPELTCHIVERLFSSVPVEESCTAVPIWALEKHLRQNQPPADLTLMAVDKISTCLFISRKGRLAMPPMVSAYTQLPADFATLLRGNRKLADDVRRIRKQGFASHIVANKDPATGGGMREFDEFYDHFYSPYVSSRHRHQAQLASRSILRMVYRQGGIQWLTQKGQRVGGGLVYQSGGDFYAMVNGLQESRAEELLQQGALAAMYGFMMQQAIELGCSRVILGGSHPTLHDGVLRYKAKWLTGLTRHEGFFSANHTLFLCSPLLDRTAAHLLSHTALIHYEPGSGYSALWVFPSDLPLTADVLEQQYRALRLRGLHRFRILLPGPPPAGFVCPPEVRLIDLHTAPQNPDELFKRHP